VLLIITLEIYSIRPLSDYFFGIQRLVPHFLQMAL